MMSFYQLKPKDVVSDNGLTYLQFRKTLKPHYWRPWVAIGLAYSVLAAVSVGVIALSRLDLPVLTPLVISASLIAGYTVAFIALFIHEAAHFNLAKSKRLNDLLCNVIVGSLIAMTCQDYRRVHMKHHTDLGKISDPERSYFNALDRAFIFESMTGLRVLKVALNYRNAHQQDTSNRRPAAPVIKLVTLLQALTLHLLAIAVLFTAAGWLAAIYWVAAIAVFFPFFASIRQVLEHRSKHASADTNYQQTPHGETHRMFGAGLVANTLGGAGFNRHLLHHWDPSISYTRLGDVEGFICNSNAVESLQAARTTYWQTFKDLYAKQR